MPSWSSWEPFVPSDPSSLLPPMTQQPEPKKMQPVAAPIPQAEQALTPSAGPLKEYPAATKNVQLPQQAPSASSWKDISDYYEVSDWWYIVAAVIAVDVIVMFLVRFFPELFGKTINIWYNRFKLEAVLADVVIILIGFGLARYAYTEWIYPRFDWNPAYFTGLSVVIQVIHDVLFYFGIIKTVPSGQNAMIDVFKDYSEAGGAKVIAADSAMMAGSSILSMLLKAAPPHLTVFFGLVAVYCVPYLLEVKNNYSGIS